MAQDIVCAQGSGSSLFYSSLCVMACELKISMWQEQATDTDQAWDITTTHKSSILNWEMGTGKTIGIMALCVRMLNADHSKPVIVAVPKPIEFQITREFETKTSLKTHFNPFGRVPRTKVSK